MEILITRSVVDNSTTPVETTEAAASVATKQDDVVSLHASEFIPCAFGEKIIVLLFRRGK